MNTSLLSDERVTGGLLVAPILIALIALAIMIVSGATAGFRPAIQDDIADVAPFVGTFRILILLFVLSWIVHLVGIGLLARLLARAGAEQLAVLAFILILVTVFSAIVKYSFEMTAELWAAGEMARVGSLPTLYEPLSTWTSSIFRLGYVIHFVAVIGIGWAILRTGILAPGLGWAAIAWSALWLVGAVAGVGAPALPLLMPTVIGIALLLD